MKATARQKWLLKVAHKEQDPFVRAKLIYDILKPVHSICGKCRNRKVCSLQATSECTMYEEAEA